LPDPVVGFQAVNWGTRRFFNDI
ncbi:MAG: hypothetical protein EZS28_047385, partial [Streblomastix strix]